MSLTAEQRAMPPEFDYAKFDLPENVTLTYRLGLHADASLLPPREQLEEQFNQSSGVIIEVPLGEDRSLLEISRHGKPRDIVAILQATSNGDHRAYQRLQEMSYSTSSGEDNWIIGLMKVMYGMRLPVTSVELPSNQKDVVDFHSLTTQLIEMPHSDSRMGYIRNLTMNRHQAAQRRDQRLLERTGPGIEQLIDRNPSMVAARQEGPLDIRKYYGSLHRSLFDAVHYQSTVNKPASGFEVLLSDDVTDSAGEEIYARYLRGFEIPNETIVQWLAQGIIEKRFGLASAMNSRARHELIQPIIAEHQPATFRDVDNIMSDLSRDSDFLRAIGTR